MLNGSVCAYVTGCVLQTTSLDKLKSNTYEERKKNKRSKEQGRVKIEEEKKRTSGPVKCTTNEINLFILSI